MFGLDSFALLAWLQDEACAKRMDQIFRKAAAGETVLYLNVLNYGEVLYIIERRYGLEKTSEVIGIIDGLPLTIVNADRALTFAAAHIKANYPISYADSFVVALAQQKGATILTGDPEFKSLSELVSIEWLSTD
jgi:predicted nucleic acid-binding protein